MGLVKMSGVIKGMTEPVGFDPVLNNNSWEQIRSASDLGVASQVWKVGDCKEITLNGTVGNLTLSNYTTCAYIIGFDHNAELEGSNRIHFQLAKTTLSSGTDIAFVDSKYAYTATTSGYFNMNASNTNSGGWSKSQMRTNICGTSLSNYSGTILAAIPDELRSVLKSVTKYTDNTANGGGSIASYVTATTDYFFLLSEYEVFGKISRSNTNESSKQRQYDYYAVGNSIVKYKHTDTSVGSNCLLRSPHANENNTFTGIYTGGSVLNLPARSCYGFAPAFCV